MLPERSRRLIEEIRGLTEEDNHRDMWHWIRVPSGPLESYSYTMVKGSKAHFIAYMNGTIRRSDMHRSRVGYWKDSVSHISSLDGTVNGRRFSDAFRKYIRGLGYIYRQYEGLDRIDYISERDGSLHIQIAAADKADLELELEVGHTIAWPSHASGETFNPRIEGNTACISSEISRTCISIRSADRAVMEACADKVMIRIHDLHDAEIVISDDISEEADSIESTIRYHESIADVAVLETPDFRFNKAFLWAKHDMLEFYTKTSRGSGWFAGFPVYSWFFGRDGLWMALAANMVGLAGLTYEHTNMLLKYSDDGRIPHEIGLADDGDQGYTIGETKFNTMYMSIDSSPLWLLASASMENWDRSRFEERHLKKVFDFIASCDTDGDGLIENDFRRGLIGWPETWANIRNGKTVDVNALWIEVLRIFGYRFGYDEYQKIRDRYMSTFFAGANSVDFVDMEYHEIRSAMQFVPGIFMRNEAIRSRIKDLSAGMMTPWGIRSMSVYDPMYDGGYHTGTVWPLMTGWFVIAAYKNGLPDLAFNQMRTFVDLAFSADDPGRINETYDAMMPQPTGQFAQGWSSSMLLLSVLQGMLNIDPLSFDPSEFRGGYHLPDGWKTVKLYRLPWRGKLYDLVFSENGPVLRDAEIAASDGARK
ncbi:amylo-alpha-1,6-glucosidase [Thermoplasma acidophilum]|uniref:amylo-alpha-1,6-glucosidase n=1 Tax=Thermoplasma acidophilum TaxID=2303 RepID=UPI0012EABDF0|nr:amylo-alpha-1,6-glucosidase [Thermoplasma acidophilum]